MSRHGLPLPATETPGEGFRGRQLHLYTSVFGGGLILRGVELPEVLETVDKSSAQATPLDGLPVDVASLEELLVDEEAQEDLPVDEESLEEFQVDEEAHEDLPWTRRAWRSSRRSSGW